MSGAAPLDVLRTVVQETTDAGSDLAQSLGTAELEEFLSRPGVVWVVGPPHAQRSSLAAALAVAVPAAVVAEHDPAALPRYPLWDVAVVVTPADQVLSAHEVRFVVEATARGQAVLLVVSRLYVLGDERARTAGRAEIERYRLSELLGPRRIPWFFDDTDGPDDAGGGTTTTAVTAAVSDVLADRQDHASAGGAAVQALLDGVVGSLAERLPDREADQKRVNAVGAQHAAHSAYLRGLATEYVARGVERLRGGNDRMAHALATVVDAADSWVAADGAAPWPDAEGPVRRAWAEVVRVAHALPTGLQAELRAEIGRVEEGVRRDLVPLVPEADPAPAPALRWQLDDLEAALGRLDDVDLGLVLQRAEARTRAALAAEQDQKRETASARRGPATASAPAASGGASTASGAEAGRGRHAARALQYGAARAAGAALKKLNSMPLAEDLRAALLADVTLAVGDRLDEVVAAVRREIAPAARAECEAGVERLHALVTTAQDAARARHAWYGAYRRLLDLRDARVPVDVP